MQTSYKKPWFSRSDWQRIVVLIIIWVSGWLVCLPVSCATDDGIPEEEHTRSVLATVKERWDIISNTRWNIQSSWRKQNERQGVLSSISNLDPWFWDLQINGESFLWFRDSVRLSIDGGVRMTNEGRKEFRQEHPSITAEDARYITFFRPGFREFSLYSRLTPSLSIEAGLMPVKLGNTLFVNPINYMERFIEDSSQIGAETFLGIKTFFSVPQHSFSFTYIPGLFQHETSSYASDTFQLGKTDNVAILQSNHYIWNGRLSFLGVLEERSNGSSGFPYVGVGGEAQIPFSSWALNAQTLLSNGDARFTLQAIDQSENRYFLPNLDSRDEFFWESFVLATIPVFASKIEVSLGYWYNERGLSAEEQDALYASLDQASHPAVFAAASGIGDSSVSYTRHVGIANLSYPRVTDHLGINNLLFLNFLDGSGKLQSYCLYELSERFTLDLGSILNFGSTSSLTGMEFLNVAVIFGMTLYF